MNFKGSRCKKCRENSASVQVEDYKVTIEHDGRSYDLVVPNLSVLVCQNCRERVLDRDANRRVSDALRAKAGLLFPSQIRQERLRLHFTQELLAKLLVIGEATLSRWETGGQIQSHHMDAMLRAFFTLDKFREFLEQRQATEHKLVLGSHAPPMPFTTNTNVLIKAIAGGAYRSTEKGEFPAASEKVALRG